MGAEKVRAPETDGSSLQLSTPPPPAHTHNGDHQQAGLGATVKGPEQGSLAYREGLPGQQWTGNTFRTCGRKLDHT